MRLFSRSRQGNAGNGQAIVVGVASVAEVIRSRGRKENIAHSFHGMIKEKAYVQVMESIPII